MFYLSASNKKASKLINLIKKKFYLFNIFLWNEFGYELYQ